MNVGMSKPMSPIATAAGNRADAKVAVDLVTDAETWDALIANAPFPHLPQSFAYGEGKRAKGWTVRRAAFRLGDRIIAFATVLERRVLGIRIVARVNRGPIFLDATPTPEAIVAVYSALKRHWRGPLLIGPALEFNDTNRALLRAAGFRLRNDGGWLSGRVDLRRSEQDIWAGFASTFRNRVRQSEKAGAPVARCRRCPEL